MREVYSRGPKRPFSNPRPCINRGRSLYHAYPTGPARPFSQTVFELDDDADRTVGARPRKYSVVHLCESKRSSFPICSLVLSIIQGSGATSVAFAIVVSNCALSPRPKCASAIEAIAQ